MGSVRIWTSMDFSKLSHTLDVVLTLSFSAFRCSQRQNCSVAASTRGFGDPCPGTLKYLEAQFQCVPGTSITALWQIITCEHIKLKLCSNI